MRRYDVLNDAGEVVRTVEEDDALRPVLADTETLRLTHIDGEPAVSGEPLLLTSEEREAMPDLPAAGDEPSEAGAIHDAEAEHVEPQPEHAPEPEHGDEPHQ